MSLSAPGIAILGSTGSIGRSSLDVLARHRDKYRVHALSAHRDWQALHLQCREHRPACAALVDASQAARLERALRADGLDTQVLAGPQALVQIAADGGLDMLLSAVVGAAGVRPVLAAATAGKRILLANKEALVCAGGFLMDRARASGALILPLDSEHSAIMQCLPPDYSGPQEAAVRRVIITASGGPGLALSDEQLQAMSPEQATDHPRWRMGPKISVDSATMMNKGLEVIEAGYLFGLGNDDIDVLIHPQSLVHAMVEYADGAMLAQLGPPDMRTAISCALAWPGRMASGVGPLDLCASALEFRRPCPRRFPCLPLARDAFVAGGGHPAALNAANEVAVERFLQGELCYPDIYRVVDGVMQGMDIAEPGDIEDVMDIDSRARMLAGEIT